MIREAWSGFLSDAFSRRLSRPLMLAAWVVSLAMPAALAQKAEPASGKSAVPTAEAGSVMPPDEARKALAQKDDPQAAREARLALLERQSRAAFAVGDRRTLISSLETLAELYGSGADWARVMAELQGNLYQYGGAQRSFEVGEKLLAADGVPPTTRAGAASLLAWNYADAGEREKGARVLGIAERAHVALGPNSGGSASLQRGLLAAQSEVARLFGNLDSSTALAREAYLLALREADLVLAAQSGNRSASQYLAELGAVSGSGGQYSYALVRQGRLAEARAVCEAGLARSRVEDPRPGAVGAWHRRLANVLLAERRFDDALKSVRNALLPYEQQGYAAGGSAVSVAKELEIMALIGLQRWAEADQAYSAQLQALQGDSAAVDRFANVNLQALLAAKNGRIGQGLQQIEGGYRYRLGLFGAKHPLTLETQGVRGAIRLMQGSNSSGLVSLLGGSISSGLSDYEALFGAILDSRSGWIELEPVGRRGAYLSIAIDDYLRYVAARSREGDGLRDRWLIDRTAQVLDWMAIGATQHAINDSTARLLSGSPELAAALREWQDARNESRDRFRDLSAGLLIDPKKLSDDERKELPARLKRDREAAQAAREKFEKINAAMAEKFPAYADLVQPRTLPPDAIAKLLNRNEVLVSIMPTRFAVFVFAVNANGDRVLRASAWSEAELDRRVAGLRRTLDIGGLAADRIPPYDFRLAHELYQELLAPFEALMPADGSLIVAARGSIASLPFAALVTAPSTEPKSAAWLVRKHAVTQLPSAAALAALRRSDVAPAAGMTMLGFGDPQFAAAAGATQSVRQLATGAAAARASSFSVERGFQYAEMPPLPDTRDELIAIARALGADPSRDLVLGAEATRAAVLRTPLIGRRVLAFATHGLLPGEMPGLSKPALAMAATDDRGGPLLVLDDILSLKMNADWVVLSACNTAGGERGGAAMSGLVRGFFFAGSRSVLATHWAVDSAAARQLVGAIFSAYATGAVAKSGSRAESLRAAQLAMIEGHLGDAAQAQPFFWAPYALFGDPVR